MKKGFTLIELLIVMVIVGTLVAIALPKYQTALERGRALEGLRNVQYAAEYAAAKHMTTGEYPSSLPQTDRIKSRFFSTPNIDTSNGTTTISRNGTDWKYQFTATISADGVSSIICGTRPNDSENDCEALNLTGNLLTRK